MSPFHRLPSAARPFVRFVVGPDSEPAYTLSGVFRFDADRMELPNRHEKLNAIEADYDWFNEHLVVPPLLKSSRLDLLACWFRSDSGEMLCRMWALALQICDMGFPVRYLWANRPGPIVYYDEHQVVARRPMPGRRRDCHWEMPLRR